MGGDVDLFDVAARDVVGTDDGAVAVDFDGCKDCPSIWIERSANLGLGRGSSCDQWGCLREAHRQRGLDGDGQLLRGRCSELDVRWVVCHRDGWENHRWMG